ncbi:uncharacterized protein M421DRAFT_425867 [Didymella exigua CBS 183.55]|uniref:Uncharacterized protein n=1 Tax=Didymella exigua CBS 183.55 TaxID=1150837 RepID=A0A6A5R833_9PLEO|nr:uncharacterized protein M421DRAFT_425867 [Didymella exigua CBS 183.55]KAF1923338.1 hypothetical protein M421DRAFT_425867 [Didymella exigua CBS 183.55]
MAIEPRRLRFDARLAQEPHARIPVHANCYNALQHDLPLSCRYMRQGRGLMRCRQAISRSGTLRVHT